MHFPLYTFHSRPSTSVEKPLLMSRILYTCRGSSTNRLLFMQNKPNFLRGQINATLCAAKDYENKWQRRVRKNKPNSNPIRTQSKPIKPKTKPKRTQNKPKTNPIKPNQTQSQDPTPKRVGRTKEWPDEAQLLARGTFSAFLTENLTHLRKNLRFCLKNPLICVKIGKIPPEFFLFLLSADASIAGAATSIGSDLPARIPQSPWYIPP